MVLAVGFLELALSDFLTKQGITVKEKVPLGVLIRKMKNAKKRNDKNDTVSEHLGFLLSQRNYYIHNIIHNISRFMSGYEIDDNEMKMFINRTQSIRDEAEFFAALFTKIHSGTVAKPDV